MLCCFMIINNAIIIKTKIQLVINFSKVFSVESLWHNNYGI